MEYLYLALIGIAGGVLGGMGMGGGTLLIPLLTLFLGIEQKYCQGLNLISFIPMCVCVLFIHKKNNLLNFNASLPLIIFGLCACIITSIIAQKTDNHTLRIIFGVFLIILSISNIILQLKKQKKLLNNISR